MFNLFLYTAQHTALDTCNCLNLFSCEPLTYLRTNLLDDKKKALPWKKAVESKWLALKKKPSVIVVVSNLLNWQCMTVFIYVLNKLTQPYITTK